MRSATSRGGPAIVFSTVRILFCHRPGRETMAWDFETEPEFQRKLDWASEFVREEVEPLDLLWPHEQFVPLDETRRKVVDPLKAEVRRQDLWATHLGPELGGQGYGQLKLALLNEILGRSQWAPIVFGCQAPDTGNAEIIAHYGTDEQKERYLRPLLEGELFSCYSMTEPHAGADPTMFTTRAVRDGDDWVINGWKYFSSNAKTASFLIVMGVTNPDVSPYKGMSMFLVPTDTPGVNIVRNMGLYGEPLNEGSHALIHYDDVRVPEDALLGGEGQAFVIAQTRLGGGRIHHAMRAMQVHGALGTTNELPFFGMIHGAGVMGLADGPTEVHKVTVARQVLRDYKPSDDIWPTEWIPKKLDAARARFAEYLEHEVGNL